MPPDASAAKVAATRGYGGQVDLDSADAAAMFSRLHELADAGGRVIVHPFDDPVVQAGQGTVGLELVSRCPSSTWCWCRWAVAASSRASRPR